MNNRLLGEVLLVVGVGVLLWGYDVAQSVRGQWTRAWSGAVPDKSMLLYLGGAVCAALGVFLLARRK